MSFADQEEHTPMAWMPVPDKDAPLFTIDAYLALERTEEERHEYLDGCVYAMAGESPDHGRICVNLTRRLAAQLDGSGCEVFSKDLKVRCGPLPRPGGSLQGLFAYPDLVVVCGALHFHDQARDVLLNPRVIVEVLSPSTEAFDRGEKFRRYRTWLPTLSDYVLVAQESPLIDHYHRQEEGTWTLHALEGLQAHLHLETIGCTVPLAEVYDRIVFQHAEEAP
jgi:Uma2 family endonuclease